METARNSIMIFRGNGVGSPSNLRGKKLFEDCEGEGKGETHRNRPKNPIPWEEFLNCETQIEGGTWECS